MAITYGYFDSINGDRKYNADQMSEYFDGIVSDGVFQSVGEALAVSAQSTPDMSVKVASGRAIINNKWIKNDADITLPITAASTAYARITSVVVQLDPSNRLIRITTKDGTPSGSPVAPEITENELEIARITVAANATSIVGSAITDKREYVHGVISQIDWGGIGGNIANQSDLQNSLGLINARIDNIIALTPGSTTGDAELADIRVGANGITYPTAGDAVRGQYSKLKESIQGIKDEVEIYKDLFVGCTITNGKYYGNQWLNTYDNAGLEILSGLELKANTTYTIGRFARNVTYGTYSWFRTTASTVNALTYLSNVGYEENGDGSFIFTTGDSAPTLYVSYYNNTAIGASNDLWIVEGRISQRPSEFPKISPLVLIPNLYNENLENAKYVKHFVNMLDYTKWIEGKYWVTSNNIIALQDNPNSAYYPNTVDLQPDTYYSISSFVINATYGTFSIVTYNGNTVTFLSYLERVGYTVLNDDTVVFKTENNHMTYLRLSVFKSDSYYKYFVSKGAGSITNGMKRDTEITIVEDFDDTNLIKVNNLYVNSTYTSSTVGWGQTKFNKVVDAINYIDNKSNLNNIYNVYIYSGEYDIYDELGGSAWLDSVTSAGGERQGLVLPDYVNLIGIGFPHLYGEVADANANATTSICCAPINCWKHNKLINLKITAKNARYCVHCESNNAYEDTDIEVLNCYMEHYGNVLAGTDNVGGGTTWGCGTGSAAKIKLINSQFVSNQSNGVYIHNNSNQKANYVELNGCYLKTPNYTTGFLLQSIGSNSEVGKCYIKDCIGDPSIWNITPLAAWDVYDFVNNEVVLHSN